MALPKKRWVTMVLIFLMAAAVPGHSKESKILFYRHPMRPEVTSPAPAKDEMGMDYIPVREGEDSAEIPVEGHAALQISAERQQLIGVKTAAVEKRPLVLTLHTVGHAGYDPDFYNVLEEYKDIISRQRSYEKRQLGQIRAQADALLDLLKLKLRLAGLSEQQIRQLIVYGQSTENLVLPADASWIYADIYEQDSLLVKPGMKVKMTATAFPGRVLEGIVRSTDEIPYAMSRTVRARIEIPDGTKFLRPGMTVHVEIKVDLGTKLVVPESAVLDSGNRKISFVDGGGGRIIPREVETGFNADGDYEILSGLKEGEKVITSANFLIDSESNLRAALQGFSKTSK